MGSGNVLNTNNCEISICETKVKNKIIILSAIDNLVKGASGQASSKYEFNVQFSRKPWFKMIKYFYILIFLINFLR